MTYALSTSLQMDKEGSDNEIESVGPKSEEKIVSIWPGSKYDIEDKGY